MLQKKFTLILIFTIAVAALGCLLFFRMTCGGRPSTRLRPAASASPRQAPVRSRRPAHTGADARTDSPEPTPEYFTVSMVGDCTLSSSLV